MQPHSSGTFFAQKLLDEIHFFRAAAVDQAIRERRVSELRMLQSNNPRKLIRQYCKIAGEVNGKQMPQGVSFSRMIDTIVDYEATTEKSPSATD